MVQPPAGVRGPVRAPRTRMPAGAMGPVNRRGGPRDFRHTYKEMPIKARQTWLRKLGFNVAVDGVLGPQTRSATKAFLEGTKARFWNNRAKAHQGGGASAPSHPADLNPGTAPIGGGGGVPKAVKSRGTPRGGKGIGGIGSLIDPDAYAKGSVEAEYGPLLGQIKRDISLQRAQGGQNLADITKWFQQLEATRAQGATADVAAQQQAEQGFNAAQQGIQNVLGGGEQGAQAAGYASAALAGLQGVGQAQGNFDRNMAAILASQGLDARRGEQGRQSQIMSDLISKRQDLFKAKGSALSKALAEAQILRTQQRGQNIDQMNALQQMGINRDQAALQMALGNQSLRQNAQNQKMSLAERQLAFDTNRAQLEDFLDQMRESHGGQNLHFSDLDEQSRLGLANSIRTMAVDPGGQNMAAAWKRIQNGLAMAGYSTKDPAIKRYGLSILRSMPGWKHWKKNKKR